MRYFTVDRRNTLSEGQIINLVNYSDVNPPELQAHINYLFPNGVTSHGETYMLRGNTPANSVNSVIELLFEYIRRSNFSSRPSRFQSVFGFEIIDGANVFRSEYGSVADEIWEVESNIAFKADMRLLTLQGSLLNLSYNAHRYWNGLSGGNNCLWEFLLVPPIRVIRRIN